MNLYFHSCGGGVRIVRENVPEDRVIPEIYKAIEELNPNYKVYYVRHWEENGLHWYDVGSHTEFFTWGVEDEIK